MVRRVGVEEKVTLIGGMARNPGFVASIKRSLETDVFVPENPEFVAALGAALTAEDNGFLQSQTTPPMPTMVSGPRFSFPKATDLLDTKNLKKNQEFWRWKESNWRDQSKDWRMAKIVTAGIDVGSVSSQCVIMIDGELFAYASRRTGSDSPTSAQRALDWALEVSDGLKRENIQFLVGTGYGRVNIPFADRALTEIACHARGANFMYGPTVRTLLDMGGQDCKAIRVDDKGKATAFLMNDKCAAGTGRGMEVIADLLAVSIEQVGPISLAVEQEPEPVSSTCVIFAKSEATALLRQGWPKNKVLAAYCSAMAHRVALLLQRIGVEEDFAITGGISKNIGVVSRIEKELGIKALPPKLDPQIAGALGAALFAKSLVEKGRG
jgi:bzd-type benzoyl-CoA reductase Q subunit